MTHALRVKSAFTTLVDKDMCGRVNVLFHVCLILSCVYLAAAFLFLVFSNYWPGPYDDYWPDMLNVERYYQHTLTFHDLIMAHNNAHRILVPRLLFIADYQLASGSNRLLVVISLGCKAMLIVLANWLLKKEAPTSRILLNALLFITVFNSVNSYHTLFSINFQWDLMLLFACLSLYFYSTPFKKNNHTTFNNFWIAWLLCLLSILSNGGGLAIPFVFLLISIVNKEKWHFLLSAILLCLIFYFNFFVLPISTPDQPSYESILPSFVFKFKIVTFFVFNLMSVAIRDYPGHEVSANYFSVFYSILLIISVMAARKTQPIYKNIFLYLACFAWMIMLITAGARSDWLGNSWGEPRYKIFSLFFIASLTIHSFLALRWFLGNLALSDHFKSAACTLNVMHGLWLAWLVNIDSYNIPFNLANKIFDAQAYMLTHVRNRYDGVGLRALRGEMDPIAHIDPFLKSHGFAYYQNKQGNSHHPDFTPVGKTWMSSMELSQLEKTCPINSGKMTTSLDEVGDTQIDMPLNTQENNFFKVAFARNSYYLIDAHGEVVGFTYLYLNPETLFPSLHIKGYARTASGKYIVEIVDNKPRCVFNLVNDEI